MNKEIKKHKKMNEKMINVAYITMIVMVKKDNNEKLRNRPAPFRYKFLPEYSPKISTAAKHIIFKLDVIKM